MSDRNITALRGGGRVPELDGLRGVAILLVVFLHYITRPPTVVIKHSIVLHWPAFWRHLSEFTWCGVDLFFVLSGFLIGGILLDHRGSPNLWRAFYARRVGRIFPVYFLLVGLAFLPWLGDAAHGSNKPVPLLAYVFFVQNLWTATGSIAAPWLGPCWSIAIEEQFYLLAPQLLVRTSRRGLLLGLGACIIGALVLRVVLLLLPSLLHFHVTPWDFTCCRIDAPACGVLGAWMVRQEAVRSALQRALPALKWSAAGLLVAALAVSQATRSHAHGAAIQQSLGLSVLAALSLAAILICVLDSGGWLAWVMRSPLLTIPGKYSYFVYLFHLFVLSFSSALRVPYWERILASLLTVSLLAWLSWRFFEQPILRRAQAIQYQPAPADSGDGNLAAEPS